jgi:transcriptional regulator with XRE-family HTH domain
MDADIGYSDTAALFRAARKRAGLNLRKFAEKLGVTYQHLSAIEHGKYAPSKRLLAALNAAEPDVAALINIYMSLPPPLQASLLTTATALATVAQSVAETGKEGGQEA